ncbi:MAG: hypothetical protein ACRDFC_00630 [Ignavibacteria bacterium]
MFLFTFSSLTSAQDFNLFNPSNEMYLFSAYDEGANAFRYNPAVLGLKHRLNATFNMFLENFNNKVYVNEYDIAVNSGNIGAGFRNSTPFSYSTFIDNTTLNTFSIGLGIGSKTISGGIHLEY